MPMNIGRSKEEQERIDKLVALMGDHIDSDIVCELWERGFFVKPASIHHHGQYEGALFDHSYEVTKALVEMTEKLGLNLTEEELYCIRWHMGAFDDKQMWNNYGRACTMYPNVLYTHTADMVAARIKGV